MSTQLFPTIMPVLAVALISFAIAYLLLQRVTKKKRTALYREAEKRCKTLLNKASKEAESIKKEKELQAKERFIELKAKHEEALHLRTRKVEEIEKKTQDKRDRLQAEIEAHKREKRKLERLQETYNDKLQALEVRHSELEKSLKKYAEELEKISGLSAEQAKAQLMETLKEQAEASAMTQIQAIVEEAELTAKLEAKKLIIKSIQRIGVEQAIENAISVFNIESDEIKGRIIGREGRNIRTFEAATGVELIVDDTPEAIILSCFDPVRREIARLALQKLVSDGRIHPARIEEVVHKTQRQLEDKIIETGKRTVTDLRISGLHPELIKIVGRMKYRSSYGQNLLQHAREVAKLSATIAAELGLSAKLAKRAGLLHDIGKVPDAESELPHAILGMEWAKRYKENPEVVNAIGAHHDEIEMTSLISPIVQVADGISGARPGVRRQLLEAYTQRLKDLEKLALGFEGVDKSYAIQAGRELRVLVKSEAMDDQGASALSYAISQKIQKEMTYPGQVKVTVIRETRAVSVAK